MSKIKFLVVTLFFAILTVGVYSCVDNEQEIKSENIRLELRKCPWCVAEDVLGMAEGGFIGSFLGPMGIAVGGALVGTYRSYKQFHGYKPSLNNDDFEGYLEYLATKYDVNDFIGDDYKIGIIHNKLLYSLIIKSDGELSTIDAFDEMRNFISVNLNDYINNHTLDKSILNLMSKIDNNLSNPLPLNYQLLFDQLNDAFNLDTNEDVIEVLRPLESLYSNDQVALQAINTTYHTYHFWKNLKNYKK